MADSNLNTSIQFLKDRVDATYAVQKAIASDWVWPLRSVADWEADSLSLDKSQPGTPASDAISAITLGDSARGALDARLAALHEQTLAAVGVMRVRAQRNPALLPVVNELSARGDSRKVIEDEATSLLSGWKEEFGPAFSPAPGITLDGFTTLLTGSLLTVPPVPSLRELKQGLSDAATRERKKVGAVSGILSRVERDAQDWYAEATSVYAAGTPNGDLIRTVPTTTTYNPSTPATPPAPPAGPSLPLQK